MQKNRAIGPRGWLGLIAMLAILAAGLPASPAAAAGPAALVRDINTIASSTGSSTPYEFVTIGNLTFFPASDPTNGFELWKTDGTAAGTQLVRDINSGLADSFPSSLTNVGGVLYFIADDGISGFELWKSDGSEVGTVRVADISPGARGGFTPTFLVLPPPEALTPVGNVVYFAADDGIRGPELWRSDGSAAGTRLVRDIVPGAAGSDPEELTNVNGTLFFSADDGGSGRELWKSNGTNVGTSNVRDIEVGPGGSSPNELTAIGSTLYFSAFTTAEGRELWKSSGTNAGTVIVRNIETGAGGSVPQQLTEVNGALYFSAFTSAEGTELWISDGTQGGTDIVRDVELGPGSSFPENLTSFSGQLFFTASTSAEGRELWKSDGGELSTTIVKDIITGPGSSIDSSTADLTVVGSILYFVANDGSTGFELWRSGGNGPSTRLVRDINPSAFESLFLLTPAVDKLIFLGIDPTDGIEPYISDGSEAGTVILKDIFNEVGSSPDDLVVTVNSKLFFGANDGTRGREPWVSDGSSGGTQIVRDLNTGLDSSLGQLGFASLNGPFMAAVGTRAYFTALNAAGEFALFSSDGTSAGTTEILNTGIFSTEAPDDLVNFNGVLAFSAVDPATLERELRVYNGSAVIDLGFSAVDNLTVVGDALYFTFDDFGAAFRAELGVCDAALTCNAIDVRPGALGSFPADLAAVGDELYFSADSGDGNGRELYRVTGAPLAAALVRDINPGAGDSDPRRITDVGGLAYFSANNGSDGEELWVSDGTPGGTIQVRDIFPGQGSSSPADLVELDGSLLFSAFNAENGRELWKSDGTEGGTVIVRDIVEGEGSGVPRDLTRVTSNRVLFSAYSSAQGIELWVTDGSTIGTAQLQDIAAGPANSSPSDFIAVGANVFFTADNVTNGRELWKIATSALNNRPPVAEDAAITASTGTTTNGTLQASDPDGDPITYSIVTNGSKGTAAITNPATGAFTYTPNAGASGTDSFTFKVNDGSIDSNIATVIVSLNNAAPVASNLSISVSGAPFTGVLPASDSNGDALTFSIVVNPTKGTVVISDTATGAFVYTPNPGAIGSDSFTFRASDGSVFSNIANVTVNLDNAAPVADDLQLDVASDPVGATLPASDPDGDPLLFSLATPPGKGTVVITNASTGAFTYTPDTGATGTDSFTFQVSDGSLTDTGTVTVNLSGVQVYLPILFN